MAHLILIARKFIHRIVHYALERIKKLYGPVLDAATWKMYLLGYRHYAVNRQLRKLFARSALHYAWLAGFSGCFTEGTTHYGLANRYDSATASEDILQ